ncbi:MAG: FecR domain-containing protein [Bacteroidetes bacterium]|nr:FecR domain-containing protein [Bacteroidota bacterium]
MMEKNLPEAQPDSLSDTRLTDEEARLADLYSSVEYARRLSQASAAKVVRMRVARRMYVRRSLQLLSAAAALVLSFALWWWLDGQKPTPDAAPMRVQNPVPERTDKALLQLSDGRMIALDSTGLLQLSEAGLAHISGSSGKGLAYEASIADQDIALKTNKIIVPPGGRFQLRLSDGTEVWLNAASSLVYPVVFGKGPREVVLSGEAFFEVTSDASRPFVIQTGGSTIQVLGTSFNVSAYEDDDVLETTLVSGALQVSLPNGKSSTLAPGQQHRFNQKTLEQQINQVDTRFYTSWREGVIYFNRVSLKELGIKLERWYDVQIRFENEKTAGLIFSGAVENSRRLDFLLALIAEASGIRYEIDGKQVIIK